MNEYILVNKNGKLDLDVIREYNVLYNIDNIDEAILFIIEISKAYKLAIEIGYVIAFKDGIMIGFMQIGFGNQTRTYLQLAPCFRFLLLINADAYIITHNHPIGAPVIPSESDVESYKQFKSISDLLQIDLIADGIIQDEKEWFDMVTNERRKFIDEWET